MIMIKIPCHYCTKYRLLVRKVEDLSKTSLLTFQMERERTESKTDSGVLINI